MYKIVVLFTVLLAGCSGCSSLPSVENCENVLYTRTGMDYHIELDCKVKVDSGIPFPGM